MCADVCKCQDNSCPTRKLCYRFTAERDEYRQSYFAKSPRGKTQTRCSEFWSNAGIPDPTDYTVQKKISVKEYNAICDRIIGLGLPVHETLMALLEEAGKYSVSQKTLGRRQQPSKRVCIGKTKEKVSQKEYRKCDKKGLKELRKRDKEGIKSQQHILKEWDKKCMKRQSKSMQRGKK